MANIIIVDDHQIFRESLAELLTHLGFKIIAQAGSGVQLMELLNDHKPDIILMDISMPEMDGHEATKNALAKFPDLKILTLSSFGDERYYYQMVSAGVKGFVLKDSGINELRQAINEILNGGSWFSSELLQKVIISLNKKTENDTKSKFSPRELEVLNFICKGFTAEQIADELNLSYDTIKTHRSNLLSKTSCNNAPALVIYAIKNKIIEI